MFGVQFGYNYWLRPGCSVVQFQFFPLWFSMGNDVKFAVVYGHVDIAVERVHDFTLEPRDPDLRKGMLAAERDGERPSVSKQRNADLPKRSDTYPELLDFYSSFDEMNVTEEDRRDFKRFMDDLKDEDREVLEAASKNPLHFTVNHLHFIQFLKKRN